MGRRSSIHSCPTSPWARRKSFLSSSMIDDEEHMVYQNPDRFFPKTHTERSESPDYMEDALEDDGENQENRHRYVNRYERCKYNSLYNSDSRILSFSIPLCESQGFSWNQDLFATQYQQKRATRYNSAKVDIAEPFSNFDQEAHASSRTKDQSTQIGSSERTGNLNSKKTHKRKNQTTKKSERKTIESSIQTVKNDCLDSLIGVKYKVIHRVQSKYIAKKGLSRKPKIEVSEIVFLDDDASVENHRASNTLSKTNECVSN